MDDKEHIELLENMVQTLCNYIIDIDACTDEVNEYIMYCLEMTSDIDNEYLN